MSQDIEFPPYSFFKNRVGQKFGELTVVGFKGSKVHPSGKRSTMWECECSCGKRVVILSVNLVRGNSKTCGCSRSRHGMVNTPEYVAWEAIHQRCSNPKNPGYKNYGGRGIRVCDSWELFDNFIRDMGRRPTSKHSLDRIDNEKGYSPENCRWTTLKVQHRNKRTNRLVTISGETKCITEWSEITGVSISGLRKRISKGWSDDLLLKPPMPRHRRVELRKQNPNRISQ